MPFTTQIDHERREIRTTVRGPVTLEDLRRHLEEGRRAGALAYPEIYDARGAQVRFTPADVRSTVGILRELRKESELGPGAIVVASDFAYGMLRMLEILAGDICPVRPFRSAEDAERWVESLRRAQNNPSTT